MENFKTQTNFLIFIRIINDRCLNLKQRTFCLTARTIDSYFDKTIFISSLNAHAFLRKFHKNAT